MEQKKGTSPVVIALAVIGGVIVLGFGGCAVCVGVGAKGVVDHAKKQEVEKAAAKESVVQTDLADMLATYKGNEIKADNKYKGKFVEVKGKVDSIKKDIVDKMYVTLGTGADFEIPQVQCYFDDAHAAAVGDLESGQKVTMRGVVKGLMGNVVLEECELVGKPEKVAPTLAACEKIAAAVKTDVACKLNPKSGDALLKDDALSLSLLVTKPVDGVYTDLAKSVSADKTYTLVKAKGLHVMWKAKDMVADATVKVTAESL